MLYLTSPFSFMGVPVRGTGLPRFLFPACHASASNFPNAINPDSLCPLLWRAAQLPSTSCTSHLEQCVPVWLEVKFQCHLHFPGRVGLVTDLAVSAADGIGIWVAELNSVESVVHLPTELQAEALG